jgi:hypothetical protein
MIARTQLAAFSFAAGGPAIMVLLTLVAFTVGFRERLNASLLMNKARRILR